MNRNTEVSDYIEKAPDSLKELMEKLRNLIHDSVPGTIEQLKWKQPVFKKDKDFCYLKYSKEHVTFGFINASLLKDPDSLLQGSGNTMRHVKIKSTKDINEKLFRSWLNSLVP